jgi:hypothetical protein
LSEDSYFVKAECSPQPGARPAESCLREEGKVKSPKPLGFQAGPGLQRDVAEVIAQ